jgi:hypothetical protein
MPAQIVCGLEKARFVLKFVRNDEILVDQISVYDRDYPQLKADVTISVNSHPCDHLFLSSGVILFWMKTPKKRTDIDKIKDLLLYGIREIEIVKVDEAFSLTLDDLPELEPDKWHHIKVKW